MEKREAEADALGPGFPLFGSSFLLPEQFGVCASVEH